MTKSRKHPARVMGVCLFMVGALLAPGAGALEPAPSAPSGPGRLGLRGLEGQELRVQVESGTSRLDYTLHLDETANRRVEGARLRITGLRDESGAQVSALRVVSADGPARETYSIEPAGTLPLTLEADLPAPGLYEATLTLLQEGALATSARLVISRPRAALNVDVEVAPVRGQLPLLGGLGEATLQFTLHEKEGSPVRLVPPVLARLLRTEPGSGGTAQQALADARVINPQGAPLESSFLLDRRMTLPLRLQLSGLPGPGRYEGTLRVGALSAPAVDIPFVLDLREGAPVAFLFIALGVVLSFLGRQYLAHERPRMMLQHQALGLARAVEEARNTLEPSSRNRELLVSLAREVEGVLADVTGRAGVGGMGVRLELLARKVACARDWLRLRGAVDELRPAELRTEPQATLDTVERLLREPRATVDTLSTAETTLANLPAELEERMRRHLTEQLTLFREELNARVSTAPVEWARRLESHVRPRLERMGEWLNRDVRAALRELEAARLAQESVVANMAPSEPVNFSASDEQEGALLEEPLPARLREEVRLFVPKLEGRQPAEGLARLERRLASLDLLVLGVILGGAILTGMRLLWMEAPTWGGLNDRLLAFLWGFGLHQVSSSGLTRVIGRDMNPDGLAGPSRQ